MGLGKLEILLLVLAALLQCAASHARQREQNNNSGMITIVYPEPGARIEAEKPMFAVDFSEVEPAVDPSAVRFIIDGVDVSSSAEITEWYLVYEPPGKLSRDTHAVMLEAADITGAALEPLSWTFTIIDKDRDLVDRMIQYEKSLGEKDNTTGHLRFMTDYVYADYTMYPSIDPTEIMERKEGVDHTLDLEISNVSSGRSILGAFSRRTQSYTGRTIDEVLIDYSDSNFSGKAGHFFFRLSDLTIVGTEMGGVKYNTNRGRWALSLFTGRTQDPETSGTFKQVTHGASGVYTWDRANSTTLTIVEGNEKRDDFYSRFSTPARDRIFSVLHEHTFNRDVSMSFEVAANKRKPRGGPAGNEQAFKFEIGGRHNGFTGDFEFYNIDKDFVPIGDGNNKYLASNREGYRGGGAYKAADWITMGGDYEVYDSLEDTDSSAPVTVRTTRRNAFVAIVSDPFKQVTYRKSKLTNTNEVSSVTDSLHVRLLAPDVSVFSNTSVTAGWTVSDYNSSIVDSVNTSYSFSLSTQYRRNLSMRFLYLDMDTEDDARNTNSENKKTGVYLDWRIAPQKYNLKSSYERTARKGDSVDTRKQELKTQFHITAREVFDYSFGLDFVNYENRINPEYDYDQAIFKSGVEMSF